MPKPNSSRPSLLLVDDTPANIEILVDLLKADYDLTIATRGAQALQLCAKAKHIDLVLLDVMMPEMDGYDVCRALRAEPATRDLPVVFLTTRNEVADLVRGFELGANDYVSKPFEPAELRARVRTQTLLRAQQIEIAARNAELKEMLHIVCHDVANHFAVVSMSLDLLQSRPEIGLEHLRPRIAAATRNGIALTTLVRDLRQAEDKPLELEPVSLAACVREACLLAEGRIQDKNLTVRIDVPEFTVVADARALTNSVIGNLVSNAIKFSDRGGAIEIGATATGDRVVLRVCDHGIGMPREVLDRLFDISKSHSRKGTEGERGTGFGMPLMRKFVLLFGGSVGVETCEKGPVPGACGTTFLISLRLAS